MDQVKLISPADPSQRILSLDVLRGFAVLGILFMNIQSFSMIEAAYLNPTACGDLTGLNKWVWILSHILGDQKFMTIFAILFGAGILLFSEKIETTGKRAAGLHYQRIFWLLVIGLIHAYFFWHGDILVSYALCAMIIFLFRKKSASKLLIIGLISISISSLLYLFFGWSMQFWPPEAIEGNLASWKPGAAIIERELAALRGSLSDQLAFRIHASLKFQTFIFLIWTGWRAGGLMLAGMALYKWGVLSAQLSRKFYGRALSVSLLVGLPIVVFGIRQNFAADWSANFSMFFGWQYNYWGSLLISFAYICLIMLLCQSAKMIKTKQALAAVGKMAFTNYLLQTLICTTIFYGHGFGLFGKVERSGQVLIMLAIWVVQLIISPLWLHHFRFGPVEWLWRTLTYKKWQPMKNH